MWPNSPSHQLYVEYLEHPDRPRKRQRIESSCEHLSSVESSRLNCDPEQSLAVANQTDLAISSLKRADLELAEAPEASCNDAVVSSKELQRHTACAERAYARRCTCFGTVCIPLHLCIERLC